MAKAKERNGQQNKIRFRFHPRVFAALGADLVTSDIVAVIELVKNSYDAFATRVDVRFCDAAADGLILEIEDNGTGMSRETIEDVWCLVATPFRAEQTQSRRGRDVRRVTGEKGLGRLSAARLGKRLEMLTKTKNGECWQVVLAWEEFSKADSLEDCEIEILSGDPKVLLSDSGTRLRILDLTTDWEGTESKSPGKKIDELEEGLSRLNPPFEKIEKFSAFLTRPGTDAKPTEIKPSPLLDNPTYRIKGEFSESGRLSYRYDYVPLTGVKRKNQEQKKWETILEDVRYFNQLTKLKSSRPSCGPFTFEFRAWDLDPESVTEAVEHFEIRGKSAMRAQIRAFKGISLYRDDVLVLPKSETSRDWLGLDLRRVSKVGTRMSTSQIVGYVGIGADQNPDITDTSDRERLARNTEVEEFEALLGYVVSLLENERDLDRTQKESEPTDLFRALNAETLLADTQELIQENASAADVLPLLTRFEKDLDKTRKKIERTFGQYSRLATIGLVAQQLVHEVGHNVSIVHEFVKLVKTHFAKTGNEGTELRRFLKLAEDALSSLQRLAERFRPLANRGFSRGRRKASFRETLETCLAARKQEIERHRVSVETRLRGSDEIQIDPGELYAVLINLLDNALYWLSKASEGHRELRIETSLARLHERLECAVHDAGPGVPKEDQDRIFWPGFTRRPNGFGMGLTVAGEIVAGHGGTLRILADGKIGGASFVFDLPLATT